MIGGMGQLDLLRRRRFWPLFWTQFFGAFNDNVFKNALVIVIAYRSMTVLGLHSELLVVACAGVFIAPFFLFSATAGQLADAVAKPRLIRWVKVAEIFVMCLATVGFVTDSLAVLLIVLFLMGLQSSFFGPAKYAILPELLERRELVGGNALVETGTFLAILLGTIVGGLFAATGGWPLALGAVVVGLAGAGLLVSLWIPELPAAVPWLRIDPEPFRPTLRILAVTRRKRDVFLAVLGISWFWMLGASFLSVLPNFGKDVLRGSEEVVTLFLTMFCIGIAAGSLGCERLSRRRLELGLVPLGSIGISVFALDLAYSASVFEPAVQMVGPSAFLTLAGAKRIAVDLFLIAVFSGFYTVPLYTLVQQGSDDAERSRVIAGNNILNAALMVLSSIMLVVLLKSGVGIPGIFFVLAVLNIGVAAYIYLLLPEFLLRFAAWVLAHISYRIQIQGEDHLPAEGPAVLVANHVSFVDWLIVAATSPRPVRFVMHRDYAELPLLRWLFRGAKVIPIASARRDPALLEQAFCRIADELEAGQIVCIFPEGRLTPDGLVQPFRTGIERIVRETPAPVVPMAVVGLWGSLFSRARRSGSTPLLRRIWKRVHVRIGQPIPPEQITADALRDTVCSLGGLPASQSELSDSG